MYVKQWRFRTYAMGHKLLHFVFIKLRLPQGVRNLLDVFDLFLIVILVERNWKKFWLLLKVLVHLSDLTIAEKLRRMDEEGSHT